MTNLLGEPPETRLPDDPAESESSDADPRTVAASHPSSSHAWAVLAEKALAAGDQDIEAYAFARTGYHRGLDALRRNGWKGFGPVPWSHEPNRGFLRALAALSIASTRIGDEEEAHRTREFLLESSREAHDELL
ncbi:DUF3151 domain-containing protein [Solicola sp. PLA-1-18]|uniref:DUF3151 domain-containing protein n=1 Tax=Solicola sp. PLA-1-18 TaxID=3380532 RepID=UPI003B7C2F1C